MFKLKTTLRSIDPQIPNDFWFTGDRWTADPAEAATYATEEEAEADGLNSPPHAIRYQAAAKPVAVEP